MSKPILVVQTQPASPDQEDEFNEWYVNEHLDHMIAVPGIAGAKRYVLSPVRAMDDAPPAELKYLVVFELDTDDIEAAKTNLRAAVDAGMPLSDALDTESIRADFYIPIDEAAG